ncbi:succinate dehydrogenase iron-sulfur subunit [Gracilibacillus kekensis]|uniref:succinate dehydrogenase n=1 Tax=Gracilibacillus kekensis TaxID=1027249 RepID=A0A1M7PML0_9BACI|nr:succinate dehydrogenase iron-sulfur subunit [Gracilibacillus kekensis]SHN18543.1 succinate dehydrogenase / fumarate reductase iron-sulfur subunit [Gracilibacillus kekensis]
MENLQVTVQRQDNPESNPYEEEFVVPYRPNMNIISVLMMIRRNPVNKQGKHTAPVQWDMNCLEEVCGACSMIINDRPRQACSTLVDRLEQPIRLKPMETFLVIRDLVIERQRMFDALKRVKAWIPIDGTYDIGSGPRMAETKRQWGYELSKCFTCGVCLEACPNVNDSSDFLGPFVFAQIDLKNIHPTGEMQKGERVKSFMGDGGLGSCGNSQNCVQVCPKGIPLTTSIAKINREATKQAFKEFFG